MSDKIYKRLAGVLVIVVVLMLAGLPAGRRSVTDVSAQIKTRFGSVQIDHDLNVDGAFTAAGGSTFTNLDLNGTTLTIDADADTTLASVSDDTPILTLGAATGVFNVATGNLKVGNGTPTLTQNGEDAYVEGTFEVDGQSQFDGGVDLNGSTLTIDADTDTTLVASSDDIITLTLGAGAGRLSLLTGNMRIGNGTPGTAQDGEDLYVEGGFEVDGTAKLDGTVNAAADVDVGTFLNLSAQSAISLTAGAIITPTGTYQLLTSAAVVTSSTTTPVATASRETGDLLIIRNANASDAITIDGTGGTVECKADIVLGASDTVTLIYNGAAWNCVANYDNS